MHRVVAGYTGLGAGCAFLLCRSDDACDIDTAHFRWEEIEKRNKELDLPSAYSPVTLKDLRYAFDGATVGYTDDRSVRLDEATKVWVEGEGTQSLWQALAEVALSAVMPRRDAQATLDLPAAHLLSAGQWVQVLGKGSRRTALDIGAGCGHITSCFAPLFDSVHAVEVSDDLVAQLRKRGFTAAKTARASPAALQALGMPTSFDAVFALNVLDRVPESDDFLRNCIALARPGALVVIALPLPYCAVSWHDQNRDKRPEDHGAWAAKHALSLDTGMDGARQSSPCGAPNSPKSSWEHAAHTTVAKLRRSGLDVLRVVRAPYLSQRDWDTAYLGPHVLDGAVFVAQKPHMAPPLMAIPA